MPSTPTAQSKSQTKRKPQDVYVATYDEDFDIIAVELLGYDGTDLQRISVTSEGKLKVAL